MARAVGADHALAEQRIVGRQFLHFGDHFGAVVRIAAERLERFEIMNERRIDAGLHHRIRLVAWFFMRSEKRLEKARVPSFMSQ